MSFLGPSRVLQLLQEFNRAKELENSTWKTVDLAALVAEARHRALADAALEAIEWGIGRRPDLTDAANQIAERIQALKGHP